MKHSEFSEKLNNGTLQFDEVYSDAVAKQLGCFEDVYDRDSFYEHVDYVLQEYMVGDDCWTDIADVLSDLKDDWDGGFDYYDWQREYGDMGFNDIIIGDSIAKDLTEAYELEMTELGLWDAEVITPTNQPQTKPDPEIQIPEFMFID